MEDDSDLDLYAQYCVLREKGLRKQAFKQLNAFIEIAKDWGLNQRYEFVERLYLIQDNNRNRYDLIPHPLYSVIVEPTVVAWVKENPSDPSGYRWLGGRENWRKAILLNKEEQIARVRLIEQIIYYAYFSTHHLPEGFIGSPSEELLGLNEANILLDGLENDKLKIKFSDEIKDCMELIQAYREYEKSTYVGTFEAWANLYDRRCY